MIQAFHTYIEYEKLQRQHNLILEFHEIIPFSYLINKHILSTIITSKVRIDRLMDKYHSNEDMYDFCDIEYYSKVKDHNSILIEYYYLLKGFDEASYLKRLKSLPKLSASIQGFKIQIIRSYNQLDNIPNINKTIHSHEKVKTQISSDLTFTEENENEIDFIKEGIFNIGFSGLNFSRSSSFSQNTKVEIPTLSKDEITDFINERLYSNNNVLTFKDEVSESEYNSVYNNSFDNYSIISVASSIIELAHRRNISILYSQFAETVNNLPELGLARISMVLDKT